MQQMVGRHMSLQAEPVEQRLLRRRPPTRHRSVSARPTKIESAASHYFRADFFNTIRQSLSVVIRAMTVAAAASALRLVGYITRQEKEANDPISLAIDRLLQVNIYSGPMASAAVWQHELSHASRI
jgi:hypothetical protein